MLPVNTREHCLLLQGHFASCHSTDNPVVRSNKQFVAFTKKIHSQVAVPITKRVGASLLARVTLNFSWWLGLDSHLSFNLSIISDHFRSTEGCWVSVKLLHQTNLVTKTSPGLLCILIKWIWPSEASPTWNISACSYQEDCSSLQAAAAISTSVCSEYAHQGLKIVLVRFYDLALEIKNMATSLEPKLALREATSRAVPDAI